ncbi:hypothetical protein TRICI_006306 [Trichomonascus ciferrii]|uniref:Condensation domain-containing protein n=1 Tax=Trichomonascus ciferrii TaxID=44093 RepID=A0A642UIF8_9ASCO|nr:hypothetical protein TRICI_006306 [Trichomonascus ciferrii]
MYTSDAMEWKEVRKGIWERPLDGLEGYFKVSADLAAAACEGREHYVVFSVLKVDLRMEDVVGSLKRAWTMMRHKLPHMASVVDNDRFVYDVISETSGLAKWLDATFVVADEHDSKELAGKHKPLTQAALYYLPKSSELAFRIHHHLIDGTGVLMFWHCFFTALASPADVAFGDEYKRLPPTMSHLLGFPRPPSQELCERAHQMFLEWAANIPAIGVPNRAGETPSKQPQTEQLLFSQQMTERLVQACKQRGVTVTSAVHAATILTMEKYADPNVKQSEYRTVCQFNLRSYLPAPYNSTDYAVSSYVGALPYNIDLPASFWDLTEDLNKYYKSAFKTDPDILELECELGRNVHRAFQQPEVQASPIPKDPIVSSLGVFENHMQRHYGDFITVNDFSMTVECILGMSTLFVYTFRDQLRLGYCFNDAFQDPNDIQTYLLEIQNILTQELQLD